MPKLENINNCLVEDFLLSNYAEKIRTAGKEYGEEDWSIAICAVCSEIFGMGNSCIARQEIQKLTIEKMKEILKTHGRGFISYTQVLVCVADEIRKHIGNWLGGKKYGGWDLVCQIWDYYCGKNPGWKKITEEVAAKLRLTESDFVKSSQGEKIKACARQKLAEIRTKIEKGLRLGLIAIEDAAEAYSRVLFEISRDYGLSEDTVRDIVREVQTPDKTDALEGKKLRLPILNVHGDGTLLDSDRSVTKVH